MKVLRPALLLFVVVIMLGAGVFFHSVWRFDLLVNDVSRPIMMETRGTKYGLTSLLPRVFPPRAKRSAVESQLKNAGYRRLESAQDIAHYEPLAFNGEEIWRREAAVRRCKASLVVYLSFSSDDLLTQARGGHHSEGCK